MRKPVVKCLLSIVLVVVFITTGFCFFVSAVDAVDYPIYSYDDTDLVYNGNGSFSLLCTIFDPTYLCQWIGTYHSSSGAVGYNRKSNQAYYNYTGQYIDTLVLQFGLDGYNYNSRDCLTSGDLPVGTVVRFDFAIRSYCGGDSYSIPRVQHFNGTSTTSWLYPDGYSQEIYVTSQEIFYFTYDFTITALNSHLGSKFQWTTQSLSGNGHFNIDNVNISYTFPIESADYCLEHNIINQDQYNIIVGSSSGGSGTDIAPWLQGDSNDYPSVAPDTLPPEVESYDTLFVPSDIDDSQIQSYLDRLDIGSWFRDFWNKFNSINIYLILIVIVLVLIFIRTLFMNFSNFIPK